MKIRWKCGELKLYFSPSAGGSKKKKKKKKKTADQRVAYVRRKNARKEGNAYVTEPGHTHSRMYIHGIDAPQKSKKNTNRAMVYFPTESGVGHVRKG